MKKITLILTLCFASFFAVGQQDIKTLKGSIDSLSIPVGEMKFTGSGGTKYLQEYKPLPEFVSMIFDTLEIKFDSLCIIGGIVYLVFLKICEILV